MHKVQLHLLVEQSALLGGFSLVMLFIAVISLFTSFLTVKHFVHVATTVRSNAGMPPSR